jgi:hypothetical protein
MNAENCDVNTECKFIENTINHLIGAKYIRLKLTFDLIFAPIINLHDY